MCAMRQIGFVLAVPLLLVLSGCADDAQAEALQECQRIAPRAVLEDEGASSFNEAKFSNVETSARESGMAWDITGTVDLELDDGERVTREWSCFTQNVDGKTYANINDVN